MDNLERCKKNIPKDMKAEDTIDSLLALVRFYRQKIDEGTLTGAEGGNYIKALVLLGLRDARLRTKHLEDMSNDPVIVNLPFDAKS